MGAEIKRLRKKIIDKQQKFNKIIKLPRGLYSLAKKENKINPTTKASAKYWCCIKHKLTIQLQTWLHFSLSPGIAHAHTIDVFIDGNEEFSWILAEPSFLSETSRDTSIVRQNWDYGITAKGETVHPGNHEVFQGENLLWVCQVIFQTGFFCTGDGFFTS